MLGRLPNAAVCSDKMDSKGFVFYEYPYPPSLIFSLNGTTFSNFKQLKTEHQRYIPLLLPFHQVREVRKFRPEVLTKGEEIIFISASTVAFGLVWKIPKNSTSGLLKITIMTFGEPSAQSFLTLKSQLSLKV